MYIIHDEIFLYQNDDLTNWRLLKIVEKEVNLK